MQLTDVVMTCSACPSQWDAKLPDGRYVYVRYRHGVLTAEVSRDQDAWDRSWLDYSAGRSLGSAYDGMMTTEDMLAELAGWPDPDPIPTPDTEPPQGADSHG